jgi:hypothetical protein
MYYALADKGTWDRLQFPTINTCHRTKLLPAYMLLHLSLSSFARKQDAVLAAVVGGNRCEVLSIHATETLIACTLVFENKRHAY